MRPHILRALALSAVLLLTVVALSGCTNPDAPSTTTEAASTSSLQNSGEPSAPAPPTASAQTPAAVEPTPVKALEAFAQLYINWTYRTLIGDQGRLAAMSVGPARLAERQAAAASSADTTITRAHIYNTGQIVSVAPDVTDPGTWVLVTREQTGGNSEYDGLQAAYHVTLTRVLRVRHGWAVNEWLPQT